MQNIEKAKNGWSEDQIVAAFGRFHNSTDEKARKKTENNLRDLLKSFKKSFFDSDDIFSIADQFVPTHCANLLGQKIIDFLEKN